MAEEKFTRNHFARLGMQPKDLKSALEKIPVELRRGLKKQEWFDIARPDLFYPKLWAEIKDDHDAADCILAMIAVIDDWEGEGNRRITVINYPAPKQKETAKPENDDWVSVVPHPVRIAVIVCAVLLVFLLCNGAATAIWGGSPATQTPTAQIEDKAPGVQTLNEWGFTPAEWQKLGQIASGYQKKDGGVMTAADFSNMIFTQLQKKNPQARRGEVRNLIVQHNWDLSLAYQNASK